MMPAREESKEITLMRDRLDINPQGDGGGCEPSNDDLLHQLIEKYENQAAPIEVNFRNLINMRPGAERLTHLVHSYPAKLIPNIPAFFIGCNELAADGSLVYDPFCGTGTVLVEALNSGKRAAGADANPLARMIARVKTTSLNEAALGAALEAISNRIPELDPSEFSPVVSRDRWFTSDAAEWIGKIKSGIDEIEHPEHRLFFMTALSQIIRKCSHADPRLSVPVRLKYGNGAEYNPLELFTKTCRQNITRISTLPEGCLPTFIGVDAREPLTSCGVGRADLIVTSPPYAGAQKYIRASSLSLGWLDMAPGAKLRSLEMLNIGREHISLQEATLPRENLSEAVRSEVARIATSSRSRADIFATYMSEMDQAAAAIAESLRIGGHLVLVMGDNRICGAPVQTSYHVRDLFLSRGLKLIVEMVDDIKSRGLMTKRNKTAGMISREHVFLMRRLK